MKLENDYHEEPEHMRKIFIGGLSSDTNDDSLRSHFGKYGEIVDCIVMRDNQTKRSRGFGFVTFSNAAAVDEVQAGRPHVLDGKTVDTKRVVPKSDNNSDRQSVKKVFVGGLKDQITDQDLKTYFSQFGPVEKIETFTDKDTGKKKGFAFVTFEDFDSVDKCYLHATSTPDRRINIQGVKVEVKKARSPQEMKGNGPMGGGGGRGGRMGGGGGRGGFNNMGGGFNQGGGFQGGYGGNNFNQGGPQGDGNWGGNMGGPNRNMMGGPPMGGPPMGGPPMGGPNMGGPNNMMGGPGSSMQGGNIQGGMGGPNMAGGPGKMQQGGYGGSQGGYNQGGYNQGGNYGNQGGNYGNQGSYNQQGGYGGAGDGSYQANPPYSGGQGYASGTGGQYTADSNMAGFNSGYSQGVQQAAVTTPAASSGTNLQTNTGNQWGNQGSQSSWGGNSIGGSQPAGGYNQGYADPSGQGAGGPMRGGGGYGSQARQQSAPYGGGGFRK